MLISLCLIVGNVEEYISRCLSSFAGFADEIVVVRAIGNQTPDATLQIAEEIYGARCFEYKNAPGHEDWPHVDNFAAARQMCFDLARGEYAFWCDTDDVLVEGSAKLIREHAERGGYPGFIFPYDIFGRGVTVPRERMVLRSAGRWINPVHETFRFHVQAELISDERVVVQHMPKPSKTGSVERNLRILQSLPDEEMNPGLLYHLHIELMGAGKKLEAVETAKKALAHPDLGKPERHEMFMNLARMVDNQAASFAFLHQAYIADPCRREALGTLATTSIDAGRPKEALAFARQMMATERPEDWSWNDRAAAYGWLGYEIYQQALRANGMFADAEQIRRGMLADAAKKLPIISLVHATRGRPVQASMARKFWLDLAENPEAIEHIFVIDSDDEASLPLCRMHHLFVGGSGGCVAAWNAGAEATVGEIIVQMSDDWIPPAKWDTEIRKRLGDLSKPAVLAVSDGHRKDELLCMAIITRARLNQQGYFFHPEFTGVYSDNWFTYQAQKDGVIVDASDLVFEHRHPAFDDKVPVDETYRKQNAEERYAEGKATLKRLKDQEAEGIMNWSQIPGWFDYQNLYKWVVDAAPKRAIVEIGSWMGKSIAFLAQGIQHRIAEGLDFEGRIFCVDTWKGEVGQAAHEKIVAEHGGSIRKAFESNLKKACVLDMVTPIESLSWEAAAQFEDGGCDFVFIDAAHDYESVKKDIAAWWPKVAPGGVLAGHDYPWHEVSKAVNEAFPKGVGTSGRCWMVTKPITVSSDMAFGISAGETTLGRAE